MANGDPFLVGVTQPPDNRATSVTMLVHNGSPSGTQHTAFWVQRVGAPVCNAAVRGDNFSAGPTGGVTQAGVLGMTVAASAGAGVVGTSTGQPNLFFGETGVMGVTNSFGVVGRSLTGVVVDEQGAFVSGTGVVGRCDAGVGMHGIATSGWGLIGQSVSRAGVTGKSVSGVGVEARSDQSHGVQAAAQSGVGVLADSVGNNGVMGRSRDAIGVEGFSDQGFAGVRGRAIRMIGVLGTSEQGVGVAGVSPANAIQGRSTGSGGASIGVSGASDAGAGVQGDSITGIGVGGRSPRGWAGYFEGNVVVVGGFYVSGGPKAAVVRHPDDTQRALFCVESPESYFEDFGEVALTGTSVTVKLQEDFAALVKRNDYQVFLTSYGPEALYVRKRSVDGFEIARVDRGAGTKRRSVRVGYRIVARRADVKAERLPEIKLPEHAARVTEVGLRAGEAELGRAEAPAPFVELDSLPAMPEIQWLDLETLAEVKPVDTKGKTRPRRTPHGSGSGQST